MSFWKRHQSKIAFAAIAICILAIGIPEIRLALDKAERYRSATAAEWGATTVWLKSAACARQTGAWLALCENGKLLPISDEAIADDPGHAFLLGLWARFAGRDATLLDTARLNIGIDVLGLAMLAAILAAMGAYWAAIVLLVFGPVVFVGWMTTAPHWSFIGVAGLQAVLPLTPAGAASGHLSRRSATIFTAIGLLGVCLGALIRHHIATMGLLVTLLTVAAIAYGRFRHRRVLRDLLLVAVLAVMAAGAPKWVLMARDALFTIEAERLIPEHGTSHTLYIGLGAVENRWGLRYDDKLGVEAAANAAPDVEAYSPAYYRLMWRLYFDRLREDPGEVARIYYEKAKALLSDRILDSGPPLWISLLIALGAQILASRETPRAQHLADRQLAINLISFAFIGLFVLQGILAHHMRIYAAPIGAFLLLLLATTTTNATTWMARRSLRLMKPRMNAP
ncbi:MAG: hypothetical protein J0J01_11435 [Reyranella sp.]|uniref:hypothetical protein n=1 Tax=Reyranella sp. TaxID=1929291 RepID=UPI001AD0A5A8|nr:hypothetical protein [Reyranella sp.]MBN9087511.1 hypothetical protein [Reyranella sp.]